MAMVAANFRYFFKQWQKLLTDPQSYWRTAFGATHHVLGFFVVSALLLGLSQLSLFKFKTLPLWQSRWQTSLSQAEQYYPDQAIFMWNGQHLTNNLVKPLTVSYPNYIAAADLGWPPTLATLLPSSEASESATATPSSLLTIDKTALTVTQGGNQSQIPLVDTPGFESPFTVTKANFPGVLAQVNQEIQTSVEFGTWLAVVLIPIFEIIKLVAEVLIPALIVWIFFRIYQWPYKFAIAWHLTLLIALVAELVQQVALWLYPSSSVPLFSLTFWILTALVLFNAPRRISLVAQ